MVVNPFSKLLVIELLVSSFPCFDSQLVSRGPRIKDLAVHKGMFVEIEEILLRKCPEVWKLNLGVGFDNLIQFGDSIQIHLLALVVVIVGQVLVPVIRI